MTRVVSSRQLFFIQLSIFLIAYLWDNLLDTDISEMLLSSFFATIVSLFFLNFSIICPIEIPAMEGLFYLIAWQGLYFVIGTEEIFGKWANMYLLALSLFICTGQILLAIFYPWRLKWKNIQEKNLYTLAVVIMIVSMILGCFLPPVLKAAPIILLILFLTHYYILFFM